MKLKDLKNGDMFIINGVRNPRTLSPLTFIMNHEELLSTKRVLVGDNNQRFWVNTDTEVEKVDRPLPERKFAYTKD